jgi:spoIIIJ-associated protein
MSNAKDFYSDSVTGAIRQACADFAISQEKLDIEVVETGSKGIFGLCKKRAHIRVNLKESTSLDSQVSEAESPKEVRESVSETEGEFIVECACEEDDKETVVEKKIKPPAEKVPSSEGATAEEKPFEMPSEEVLESIQADLSEIVQLMGFESEVSVQVVDKAIHCHINGAHEESIVGPDGRTLDSLQYLIRKMVSRRLPNRMIVDLDAGNFRERRMKELQQLAAEMAEQVKENGKTKAISALNPSERRVVHVALQDDKGVRSRSVGDGIFKKVLIYKPGKGRKSGGRRRGRQSSGGASKQ